MTDTASPNIFAAFGGTTDAARREDLIRRWGMPAGVVARMTEDAILDAWTAYAVDDLPLSPEEVDRIDQAERLERRRQQRQANRNQFVEDALALEAESAESAGMVGYMARVLVQATMPHSRPDANEYTRRNGNLTVAITALSDIGLPYGSYPRLLLAWLTTEAVRTQSSTLHLGATLSEFMHKLGLVGTGGRWGTIPRLKEQADRLFGSSVIAYENVSDVSGRVRSRGSRISVAEEWDLWWDPHRFGDEAAGQGGLFSSWVKLSEKFYGQVVDRPVPVDLRAIRCLKKSPLALDLYAFTTYRVSYLSRRVEIPWEALMMQLGANYQDTPQGVRDFKKKLLAALRKVATVYPDLRADEGERGLILLPSPTHVPRRTPT